MTDRLTALINQKLKYFSKIAQVTTENIAQAELKGAKKRELIPFSTIYKQATYEKDTLGRRYNDIKKVQIKDSHIHTTKEEISPEMESMKMGRITREHDNLVKILKSFSAMHESVLK